MSLERDIKVNTELMVDEEQSSCFRGNALGPFGATEPIGGARPGALVCPDVLRRE